MAIRCHCACAYVPAKFRRVLEPISGLDYAAPMFFPKLKILSVAIVLLLAGCGAPSFLVTPVSSTTSLREEEVQPGTGWSSGKIAIIEVEGLLADVKTGSFLGPTENKLSLFVQQLDKAEQDDQGDRAACEFAGWDRDRVRYDVRVGPAFQKQNA
jgi:hypothetical protein